MNLISWVILGLIAGWLASVIMKSSQGPLMDIVVGIIGAVIGGFLVSLFGQAGVNGFNIYSLVVATIGAIVLIWLRRTII